MRAKFSVVVFALAVLVSSCITTNIKGRPATKPSEEEAAQYNLELGVSYLRQGQLKTAQAKLEKAIEQNPNLVSAYSILGLVFERLGDLPGAERQYRHAVSLKPDDPDALNSLAVFLCQRDKPYSREAEADFKRALAVPTSKADTNRAMLYFNAGTCMKINDLPQAEEYLRSALALDASFREALFELGDVTYQRGNYLQARAFVERYLGSGPASSSALWLAIRVETALGDRGAAASYAMRLKRDFPDAKETGELIDQERAGHGS